MGRNERTGQGISLPTGDTGMLTKCLRERQARVAAGVAIALLATASPSFAQVGKSLGNC